MNKFNKYPSYKDSEIEWAGQIPSHWEVLKLKHIFSEKKIKHNPSLNCGSISFGEVVYKNDESVPESTKASYQEVLEGEFLINPLNLNYDLKSLRIALSELNVVVSSGYIVLNNHVEINNRYYKYLLHVYDIAYMKLLGSGVRQTINFNHISSSLLANPPLPEQTAIANFLDKKTAEIKEFIALKEKTIELLKERKMVIIDQAVTKGLDPTVEMKDSGIEWLGEVPKHWELHRVKKFYSLKNKRSKNGKEQLLSVSEVHGIVPRNTINVTMFEANSYVGYKLCDPNDYVVNSLWAWSKGLGISKYSGIISTAYSVYKLRNNNLNSEFMNFLVRSNTYQSYYKIFSKGIWISRLQLSDSDALRMPFAIPNVDEQNLIVDWIINQEKSIDELISNTEIEISKIKEYQQSLISEVVTGKVDVRNN